MLEAYADLCTLAVLILCSPFLWGAQCFVGGISAGQALPQHRLFAGRFRIGEKEFTQDIRR